MAIVTLDKKELLRLTGRKLGDRELADRLSMLGAPVESVTATGVVVDISPNRPDWLCEQGLARSLSAFLGIKAGLRAYRVQKSAYRVHVDRSVGPVRPFTACAVVTGLRFDDARIKQVIQAQEKLHATYARDRKKAAIGIYPLEHIAWPIRYLARKPGDIRFQPLESSRPMTAREILERHPTGKAYAHLLASLDRYPLFVDAQDRVLSMPPIINSEQTGRVTSATKDVFIECSGFDLRSLKVLLNVIVTMLADMGGTIHSVEVSSGSKIATPDLAPQQVKLDAGAVGSLLGLRLDDAQIKRFLARMGIGYQKGIASVPAYRADVMHAVDLAEDIAIAYGYDRLQPEIPHVATIGAGDPLAAFQETMADLLSGLGLLEAETYHLTNAPAQTDRMLLPGDVVQLANALTVDYNALRSWMLPSLMDVLKVNKHHEYPQRLFSIGTVFAKERGSATGVGERKSLCIVSSHPRADYTEIRQLTEYVLYHLRMQPTIEEAVHPSFIPGRCAHVRVDKRILATFGELHPHVLRNWELEMPVAALELDLQALFSLARK